MENPNPNPTQEQPNKPTQEQPTQQPAAAAPAPAAGDDKDKEIARLKAENDSFKQKETEAEKNRIEAEKKKDEDTGNFKKLYEDEKAKSTTLETDKSKIQKEFEDFKHQITVKEIATKHGVADLADRLRGTTAEELEADAQKLATMIGKPKAGAGGANPPPPGAGGAGGQPSKQTPTKGTPRIDPIRI